MIYSKDIILLSGFDSQNALFPETRLKAAVTFDKEVLEFNLAGFYFFAQTGFEERVRFGGFTFELRRGNDVVYQLQKEVDFNTQTSWIFENMAFETSLYKDIDLIYMTAFVTTITAMENEDQLNLHTGVYLRPRRY